jgi:hypothetical protein
MDVIDGHSFLVWNQAEVKGMDRSPTSRIEDIFNL